MDRKKARNGAGGGHSRQVSVQSGDLLMQIPPAPLPNPRFFRRSISGYSPGPARGVQAPVPQVREPPLLLSVTFSSEVPPGCLTTGALPAASPRLVMLSPRCTTFPSIRRCSSWKQLPDVEFYLISATGLGLIKGILLGFRVAKELRAHRNYGAGVV